MHFWRIKIQRVSENSIWTVSALASERRVKIDDTLQPMLSSCITERTENLLHRLMCTQIAGSHIAAVTFKSVLYVWSLCITSEYIILFFFFQHLLGWFAVCLLIWGSLKTLGELRSQILKRTMKQLMVRNYPFPCVRIQQLGFNKEKRSLKWIFACFPYL